MSKNKPPFRPNKRAPSYAHFERILKEDRRYQWKQKQPIKRLTLDGYYYDAKSIQDVIAFALHKRANKNGRE